MTITRITGRNAIDQAEALGLQLHKFADAVDGARAVTIAEAREIASEDPSLLYVDQADDGIQLPPPPAEIIVPGTIAELREIRDAIIARINAADARFAEIVAELWSVPTLSARAEELRGLRNAAFAEIRRERSTLAELLVELRKQEARRPAARPSSLFLLTA